MRAFIFSLDAFVAFTLALVAIYSLIFFSSVPSSYYYLLTQGHYLSRDVLMSLSTAPCDLDVYTCNNPDASLLENIASEDNPDYQKNLIQSTVGMMVPEQFGYVVEISEDQGQTWQVVYNTTEPGDPHADIKKKLTVSSQVIAFDYAGNVKKLGYSPYNYMTCGAAAYAAGPGNGSTEGFVDFGIITCGTMEIVGEENETAIGNTHPSNVLGGDLVPSSEIAVVKLTVFI